MHLKKIFYISHLVRKLWSECMFSLFYFHIDFYMGTSANQLPLSCGRHRGSVCSTVALMHTDPGSDSPLGPTVSPCLWVYSYSTKTCSCSDTACIIRNYRKILINKQKCILELKSPVSS